MVVINANGINESRGVVTVVTAVGVTTGPDIIKLRARVGCFKGMGDAIIAQESDGHKFINVLKTVRDVVVETA